MTVIYDLNVAAALAQILAVLLLAVGFSTARKGALRRRASAEQKKWRERMRALGTEQRLWALLVQASSVGAALAICFFVFALAGVPLLGDNRALGAMYVFALVLSMASTFGLVLALMRDLSEHVGLED